MKAKGMQLDKNNIKIMVNKIKNINLLNFKIRRAQIKEVKKFKYLDNNITQDGRY